MLSLKTILHPTDFSERSEYAFRLACTLARDHGARLVVLHVSELPWAVAGEGMMFLPEKAALQRLNEKLHELRPTEPGISVEYRLAEGDPASEILAAAYQTKCDLIALGTHGRTGLSRLLMGSVAELVLREAPCPVVTVKSQPPEENPRDQSCQATARQPAGSTAG
jgi:nucleotide-binding universal stress UspA family protein